jgi:hypothetical protein
MRVPEQKWVRDVERIFKYDFIYRIRLNENVPIYE